jgi:hypothetical protein
LANELGGCVISPEGGHPAIEGVGALGVPLEVFAGVVRLARVGVHVVGRSYGPPRSVEPESTLHVQAMKSYPAIWVSDSRGHDLRAEADPCQVSCSTHIGQRLPDNSGKDLLDHLG